MSFKPFRSTFAKTRVMAVLALTATLFAAGCATTGGPKTRIDYDKSAECSVYRTYGFPKETGTDRGGYSTLVTSYLKSAMSSQMEARGYKFSEDRPDLLVNFYMNTRERTEIRPSASASLGYGYYGYRYGLYNAWPLYDDDRTVTYKVGTLNIDIVDAEKKQLVWEGVAEGRVSEEELQNPKVAINAVVTELMRQYPGRPNM